TGGAQPLAFAHAGRNAQANGARRFLAGAGVGALQPDHALAAVQCLVERNHDVRFGVGAGKPIGRTRAGEAAATRAEKLLEEITEARGAAEVIVKVTLRPRPRATRAVRTGMRATGRGVLFVGLPVRAEFVVFAPLVRIAQHLVRFVYLLKLRLSAGFVLGDIRM